MQFSLCQFDTDAQAILAILNHAILHTTALYEYQPRTMATMQTWFANKSAGNFPVWGLKMPVASCWLLVVMAPSALFRPLNIRWNIQCMCTQISRAKVMAA